MNNVANPVLLKTLSGPIIFITPSNNMIYFNNLHFYMCKFLQIPRLPPVKFRQFRYRHIDFY